MLLLNSISPLKATAHLATLINFLISSYFLQLKTVLIVHNSSSSNNLQREYLNYVRLAFDNELFHEELSPALVWLDVALMNHVQFEAQMLLSVDFAIEGFITILPNTSTFLHARYYATRNSKLRLKDKFYLFLCEVHENATDFLATEILQFYPHHLLVTPQTEKLSPPELPYNPINFELWTQKFVGSTDNLKAVLLDVFLANETFTQNAELYPNKLLDLKGRTLKAGTLTYIPYSVGDYVEPGTGNTDPLSANEPNLSVSWVGSEAEITRSFCEIRNCHLRVKPYGEDNWGVVFENESSEGMLGGIYSQRVEFAIGCLYDWYANLTETSHTIALSSVTILGPAPGLTPPWYTIIAPFKPQLWMFVLTTMLICSMVLYVLRISFFNIESHKHQRIRKIKHFEFIQQAYLDIFAIFLQRSIDTTGIDRLAFRILMAILFAATITLENTYSGQLKSILTVPQYSDPIDTSDKWIKTNYIWAAPAPIWVESIQDSTLRKDQLITESFRILDYESLYNLSFSHNYGLAIERLQSGTFSFGKYITEEAMNTKIALKDDLYYDYTRAVSIRGWPLMPLFNSHVRICMESGLFEQWERISVKRFLDPRTQERIIATVIGFQGDEPLKVLSIENIAGALFGLFIGYVLATVALIVEIFGHELKQKLLKIKNVLK